MYKLKILAVDDDPDILDLLIATLEDDYQIIRAKNGKEAIERAKKESPELLILDYNLPDIQGPDICKTLRKDPFFLHVPILMLTGKGEIENKIEGLEAGVDDYMLKPFSPQELVARIKMIIKRSNINLDANPLTRLPGNVSVNKEIEEKIVNKTDFAVLYIDIDNFKALNDYYGFEKGDTVIKETSQIIIASVQKQGAVSDFIGHIGGDDFVVITLPENAEAIAKKITADFDNAAAQFFEKKDMLKGYIETKGRDNQVHRFGFLTISIGIILSQGQNFTHTAQISSLGAETKALAKKFPESKYIINQRKL